MHNDIHNGMFKFTEIGIYYDLSCLAYSLTYTCVYICIRVYTIYDTYNRLEIDLSVFNVYRINNCSLPFRK